MSLPEEFLAEFGKPKGKAPKPSVTNFPTNFDLVADIPTPLDFSAADFNNLGGQDIVIKISVTEGIVEALATSKVDIYGSGTDELYLVGNPAHIRQLLKDAVTVTYTGDTDGDIDLDFSIYWEGEFETLGQTEVAVEPNFTVISGTPQADELAGADGQDIIYGLEDNDLLKGRGGNDTIFGQEGDDTLIGGAGADELDGGVGNDVLQYIGSLAGVNIDLNLGGDGFQQAAGGDAEGDQISNFEHVYGSDFGDVIIGDAGRNILFGYDGDDSISAGAGDDVVRGGEGADTLDGGDGLDWLRYLESSTGVSVNFETGAMSGGDAEGDVISGFENVQGSEHGDIIVGDATANYIIGFEGDDVIDGGAGRDTIRGGEGADTIEGGDDIDTLQYTGSSAGVSVNLVTGVGSGGDAEGDFISGIENVYTTEFDDELIGGEGRNYLYGYGGDDTLNGGEGNDVLRGFAGADNFVFDSSLEASNVDRILDFESGIDLIMLANELFTSLANGVLDAAGFAVNAGGLANTADQRIIYDDATGHLYYDTDGSGSTEGVQFASLSSIPTIDETDFFVF